MNNHFSLEEWSDFARQKTPPEQRGPMQIHLDGGCRTCGTVLALWTKVREVAALESSFQPPESGVRCARALFQILAVHGSGEARVRMARMAGFGRMVLDGVRNSGESPEARHFLFREGTVLLDAHLEPRPGSDMISMVGQVLDSTPGGQRFEGRNVNLLREKEKLAHAVTNPFGEFQLEFLPGNDLVLAIEIEENSYIASLLPTAMGN